MPVAADRAGLIIAAQAGEPAALNALLRVSQTDARRYARRHCQASDVDDAVQEALLRLTRHIRALRAAAAFSGWLLTVVRRECSRLSRAMFHGKSLDDAEVEAFLVARSDEGLRRDLTLALESLPAHYRAVVLLRDFEDLTIAEISGRLGEPAGAVKSRLRRARALVREYLLSSGRLADS